MDTTQRFGIHKSRGEIGHSRKGLEMGFENRASTNPGSGFVGIPPGSVSESFKEFRAGLVMGRTNQIEVKEA